jgi:hypothetical protein
MKCGISGEGERHWTLSIEVNRDWNAGITPLSQEPYIYNPVQQIRLHNATMATTPLTPGTILPKERYPTTYREQQDMSGNNYREPIDPLQ